MTDRREFIVGASAFATALASMKGFAQCREATGDPDLDLRQSEIDAVSVGLYGAYLRDGNTRSLAALDRLEAAFDKVMREVKGTVVSDLNKPAIWYLYNMGLIVKTPTQTFSIDLVHRRGVRFAPLLDFALITHKHGDHWRKNFYDAMNAAKKTVVSNFLDNKKAKVCGFTPEKEKTIKIGDVTVIAGRCDHNDKLIDFTTPFEVQIGDYTIYHSGDCGRHDKLRVTRKPDIWVVHPHCGMNPITPCRKKIHPKRVVLAHLQELGHAPGHWRWTYRDGVDLIKGFAKWGHKAVMPLWGERIA